MRTDVKLAIGFNSEGTRAKLGKDALNRICHIYVTSPTHEQIFLILIFSWLYIKTGSLNFSINEFDAKNPNKCLHVHEQINLVT